MTATELIRIYSYYLPYDLYFTNVDVKKLVEASGQKYHPTKLVGIIGDSLFFGKDDTGHQCKNTPYRPLLKELNLDSLIRSKFDKPLDALDQSFVTYFNDEWFDLEDDVNNVSYTSYPVGALEWLLKHHYDVFGLVKLDIADGIQ